MFSLALPRRGRVKRRLRYAGLLALHGVRYHYLSLVSISVIGGLLVLALTSTSFETDQPAAAAPVADFTPWPTATPGIVARRTATAVPAARSVIYYVVDSEARRTEIEAAVQVDMTNEALRGYAPLHSVTRRFIMIEDWRDEAETLEFLRQLAISPPVDGTQVRVIDLR